MQTVVLGFPQADILAICRENHISVDVMDMTILRWVVDCRETFPKKNISGEVAFALTFSQFRDELPIAGLQKSAFYSRIRSLSSFGFLTRIDEGRTAYYRMGELLLRLLNTPSSSHQVVHEPEPTDEELAIAAYNEWRSQEPKLPASVLESLSGKSTLSAETDIPANRTIVRKTDKYSGKPDISPKNGQTLVRKTDISPKNGQSSETPNICTNLVRTLEPSNNNQPSKPQEITSVLRPTDNNKLSISQELSDTHPVEKDLKENIPYGHIKEKGKKKAPKGSEVTALLLPILDESSLAAPLKEALRGWLEYKAERKEKYVPTGFKSLLTQTKKNAEKYGEDAVLDLIEECKANNYQGIIWDKLAKLPVKAQQPKLETEHPAAKRPDPEIEWRKSKFAPPDYSAGLRSISTSELREYPKHSGKYVPYWMIPGWMVEYPVGSGKYAQYCDLPDYDPEKDENHWW